jgi:hypothetical protein
MTGWANRVRPSGPSEFADIRAAAADLERQAQRIPGRTGPMIFSTVTQVLFLGTALVSTVLASLHLYNKLSRQHAASRDDRSPEPEEDRRPVRRHSAVGHGRE